jgi:hypothetical protein
MREGVVEEVWINFREARTEFKVGGRNYYE